MTVAYDLPSWHIQALEWFELNAGRTFAKRPFDVGLPKKITSLQRGIWKPGETKYAVSVVQTHKGVYEDLDPIDEGDGVWRYFYHQEGQSTEDLRDPGRLYSNAGLLQCMRDAVPVGVIIPALTGKGYQVLGLALVVSRAAGYFELLGPVSLQADSIPVVAEQNAHVSVSLMELPLEPFDPNAAQDTRLKVIAAVSRRQGAPRFRRALITAYEGRCAMTQYDAPAALEAAHILPYRGPQTNHPTNGLLLRADMHDLFDLGLVAVDPESMRLLVAAELVNTRYGQYANQPLFVPSEPQLRPNGEALERHRAQSAVA